MENKIQQLIKDLEYRQALCIELLNNAKEDDAPIWIETKYKGMISAFHQSIVLAKLLER